MYTFAYTEDVAAVAGMPERGMVAKMCLVRKKKREADLFRGRWIVQYGERIVGLDEIGAEAGLSSYFGTVGGEVFGESSRK